LSTPEVVHIRLNFNDEIMTMADDRSQCHKDARYWLPSENMDRIDVYLRMNGLEKIQCSSHFTKLLAGRIVVRL